MQTRPKTKILTGLGCFRRLFALAWQRPLLGPFARFIWNIGRGITPFTFGSSFGGRCNLSFCFGCCCLSFGGCLCSRPHAEPKEISGNQRNVSIWKLNDVQLFKTSTGHLQSIWSWHTKAKIQLLVANYFLKTEGTAWPGHPSHKLQWPLAKQL